MGSIEFIRYPNHYIWPSNVSCTYPVRNPVRVNVVLGYSEARNVYAYDKGIKEKYHYLTFDQMITGDNDKFYNWFINVCVGPKYTFTYKDEDGASHTVRWMDTEYPFTEVSPGRFAGTMTLREVL
jgi:hypothetical protein